MTYQYNLWDIDNDKHKDEIEFISNGGAHSYYHLRIRLSSKKKWIEFPTFEIDLPYPHKIKNLTELGEMYPQFVVYDFDDDDLKEIYLNLYNLSSIPTGYGLTSKQILIDYEDDKLNVIDFKK
ncbi:hypothetical protein M4I21_12320 [Cellulophaga sp. 20_2_10]|uniref:hypothetical protein n=1 Tax=Cellulophaga sp. 20_2_10 TaxID=2942476 RepID=UPI00201A6638|nr:hypothetical protein [Cellulophaga sp. 20_2_10]MCL5246601.1 hypothetical protein [Cellulophaga sp. 20_2_10]